MKSEELRVESCGLATGQLIEGVFDSVARQCREVWVDGRLRSFETIESIRRRLPYSASRPFGTFPDYGDRVFDSVAKVWRVAEKDGGNGTK